MKKETLKTYGLGSLLNVFSLEKKRKKILLLNKSEAAHKLHGLYDQTIAKHKLEDLHPDFYSLLTENARNPMPPSSIEGGSIKRLVRGNRSKYGVIKFERANNRPMYKLDTLVDWFNDYYVPELLKVA